MRRRLVPQLLGICICLLLLTACDGPGCFTDNLSTISEDSLVLYANGTKEDKSEPPRWETDLATGATRLINPPPPTSQIGKWLPTSIYLSEGDTLEISTQGLISLCPSFGMSLTGDQSVAESLGEYIQVYAGTPPIKDYIGKRFNVFANQEGKLRTGLRLQRGDIIEILLGQPNTFAAENRARVDPDYEWTYHGERMYMQVGNFKRQLNTVVKQINGQNYYGYSSQSCSGGSGGSTNCSSTPIPEGGDLYLYYYDLPGKYGNNEGNYAAYIKKYGCPSTDGAPNLSTGYGNVMAALTYDDPNVVAIPASEKFILTPRMDQRQIEQDKGGRLWLIVNDNHYSDNSGFYNVTIKSTSSLGDGPISSLISTITNSIRGRVFSAAETMYKELTFSTRNPEFRNSQLGIARALITLYLIFFSAKFMMGLVQMPQITFVKHMVKIGIIIALFSPQSWDFFSQNFFDLFIGGAAQLMNGMTGNIGSTNNPWVFVDYALRMFFGPTMLYKVIGMLFYFPIGWVYLVLLVMCIGTFLGAVFNAIFHVIFASLVVGLLLVLAPVFICFALFDQTKGLFTNWVNLAFRNILEPAFILMGLTILTQLFLIALSLAMGYSVCWKCAIPIQLHLPFLPPSHTLFCINWFVPWGHDPYGLGFSGPNLLRSLTAILMMFIFVKLLKKFNEFTKELMTWLVGYSDAAEVSFASGRADAASAAAEGLKDSVLTPFGMDEESRQIRKNDFNKRMFNLKMDQLQSGGGSGGGSGSGSGGRLRPPTTGLDRTSGGNEDSSTGSGGRNLAGGAAALVGADGAQSADVTTSTPTEGGLDVSGPRHENVGDVTGTTDLHNRAGVEFREQVAQSGSVPGTRIGAHREDATRGGVGDPVDTSLVGQALLNIDSEGGVVPNQTQEQDQLQQGIETADGPPTTEENQRVERPGTEELQQAPVTDSEDPRDLSNEGDASLSPHEGDLPMSPHDGTDRGGAQTQETFSMEGDGGDQTSPIEEDIPSSPDEGSDVQQQRDPLLDPAGDDSDNEIEDDFSGSQSDDFDNDGGDNDD